MEKNEQLKKFISLCETSSFPHREELLKGVGTGDYSFEDYSASEIPAGQLLGVYERRMDILRKIIRSSELVGTHAERLLGDTENFVRELENVSDESVNFWRFSVDEKSEYIVFEGVNAERVLGCLLTVDRMNVYDDEWVAIWGKRGDL